MEKPKIVGSVRVRVHFSLLLIRVRIGSWQNLGSGSVRFFWVRVLSHLYFPAAEHHRPLACTKLHCSVQTEARVTCVCVCVCVNELSRVAAWKRRGRESNLRPVDRNSTSLFTTSIRDWEN